ncbi:MAG: aminotransferase class I/II-fold pyridoxal phosphate-dependent enzyme, partial [Pseudomonadota bacterium]|nr:aminotransferase class I/II-fold pyridoxal phosphate-dependent enzyme [Pseudomonadota bacterium]
MTWTSEQYTDHFSSHIEKLKEDGRYRTFAVLERLRGDYPWALLHSADGTTKKVTVWCSNDYLGMSQHPVVLEAMKLALDRWGAGSGGTRNIGGTAYIHARLENELALWHGKQAALLFNSGYTANEAALSALIKLLPGAIVFSDSENHASMIAGINK